MILLDLERFRKKELIELKQEELKEIEGGSLLGILAVAFVIGVIWAVLD